MRNPRKLSLSVAPLSSAAARSITTGGAPRPREEVVVVGCLLETLPRALSHPDWSAARAGRFVLSARPRPCCLLEAPK